MMSHRAVQRHRHPPGLIFTVSQFPGLARPPFEKTCNFRHRFRKLVSAGAPRPLASLAAGRPGLGGRSVHRARHPRRRACSGWSRHRVRSLARGRPTTTTKGRRRSARCSPGPVQRRARLEVNGDVLVVIVQERPTVADGRFFVGNKGVQQGRVLQGDAAPTAEASAYDRALIDRAEQELKRQYINRSLYGAEVVTTVTPTERNRVNLTFTSPRPPARIRRSTSSATRRSTEASCAICSISTPAAGCRGTPRATSTRAKLNADLEARSFYLARGYLEFRSTPRRSPCRPTKEITSHHHQHDRGERFVVSGVSLEGDHLAREDEFQPLVASGRRGLQRRPRDEDHQGLHRFFGNFVARSPRRGCPGGRPRQTTACPSSCITRAPRAAPTCGASTSAGKRTATRSSGSSASSNPAWYDGEKIAVA